MMNNIVFVFVMFLVLLTIAPEKVSNIDIRAWAIVAASAIFFDVLNLWMMRKRRKGEG